MGRGSPYYIGGTIIQGGSSESVVTLSNNTAACTLAGLTLRAGSVGVVGIATAATIRNCRVMDNVTYGLELSEGSAPHLDRCLITANGRAGITMHMQGGRSPVYCEPVIENCIIVDNGEASIAGGRPVIVDSLVSDVEL